MLPIYIVVALFLFVSDVIIAQENHQHPQRPWDQWAEHNPDWVEHIDPFRIVDNIYFVGTKGLSSFLITSNEGHILLDGGMPQNAKQIAQNIKTLGFDIKDVKILLNSHAHFDHSGGLKTLKDLSGARLMANEGDKSALEGGFYLGYEDNINYSAPPVKVDSLVEHDQSVSLDDIKLTAKLTPGHTRGCTSWTMKVEDQGQEFDVLFFCGASVAGNRLKPEQYEGIIDDYRHTFALTRSWRPDILLVNHPFYFDMLNRRKRQLSGDSQAFIDNEAFGKLHQQLEQDFKNRLQEAMLKAGE
jgi:metallo-beta-lactamase class B